jgi:Transglutaminase-like superfamily
MLYLSDHVFCREFADGAVLLDLRTGRYLGLAAVDLPLLKARIVNWPGVEPKTSQPADLATDDSKAHPLIAALLARGIITSLAACAPRAPASSPPTSLMTTGTAAAMDCARGSLPLSHIFTFILSLLEVRLRARGGRLEPLVNWLERRQRFLAASSCDEASLVSLLASHARLRLWFYTARNHCLSDSLILSVFLTRNRVPCTFVIAVATKPFLAHAWVQIEEAVLNDTAEHTQMFSPLLAAGTAA